MRQVLHEIKIPTRGRGLYEFTDTVTAWVAQHGFQSGLVTLLLRHTSASLLIQENADPDDPMRAVRNIMNLPEVMAEYDRTLTEANLKALFASQPAQ